MEDKEVEGMLTEVKWRQRMLEEKEAEGMLKEEK